MVQYFLKFRRLESRTGSIEEACGVLDKVGAVYGLLYI